MVKLLRVILLLMLAAPSFAGVQKAVENKELEQQIQGNYPVLPRENLPQGSIQKAWETSRATDGVRHVRYSQHKRVVVVTREFMTTEILLPSWEQIEEKNIVVGDPESFMVRAVAPNLISVQPAIAGADTSLKILGNSGWLYSFYVVSHGYNSTQLPDLTINMHVPGPKLVATGGGFIKPVLVTNAKTEAIDATDYLEKNDLSFTEIDFNYTMYGDQSIAPERVYAAGSVTVLDYGSKRLQENELPRVVAVIDGIDTPVNNAREGDKILVWHKGILALQHGDKTTCIFPSNLAPKYKGKP